MRFCRAAICCWAVRYLLLRCAAASSRLLGKQHAGAELEVLGRDLIGAVDRAGAGRRAAVIVRTWLVTTVAV